MTTAEFRRRGNTWQIRVSGHADFAEGGHDPVCAACSILAYTLLECAARAEQRGELYRLQTETRPGFAALSFTVGKRGEALHEAVETVRTGYELLARHEPAHVRVM